MKTADERILHLIQLAAHRLRTASDQQALTLAGVTTAQAAVLHAVAQSPGISQRAVAHALKLRESAMTSMVKRLTTAGLLLRIDNVADARAWSLQLSGKGHSALNAMRPSLDRLNGRLTEVIGEHRVSEFAAVLQCVIEAKFEE